METGGVYEVYLPDQDMRSERWARQVDSEVSGD